MTQTTTELLDKLRDYLVSHECESDINAASVAEELDQRLSSGEPLPDQWKGPSSEFDNLQAEKRDLEKLLSNESTMCMGIVTERDALRLKLSDRDVVEKWALSLRAERLCMIGVDRTSEVPVYEITLTDMQKMCVDEFSGELKEQYEFSFKAPTPDEAYHLAAEWVRGQQP
jgi:hypothetical protein